MSKKHIVLEVGRMKGQGFLSPSISVGMREIRKNDKMQNISKKLRATLVYESNNMKKQRLRNANSYWAKWNYIKYATETIRYSFKHNLEAECDLNVLEDSWVGDTELETVEGLGRKMSLLDMRCESLKEAIYSMDSFGETEERGGDKTVGGVNPDTLYRLIDERHFVGNSHGNGLEMAGKDAADTRGDSTNEAHNGEFFEEDFGSEQISSLGTMIGGHDDNDATKNLPQSHEKPNIFHSEDLVPGDAFDDFENSEIFSQKKSTKTDKEVPNSQDVPGGHYSDEEDENSQASDDEKQDNAQKPNLPKIIIDGEQLESSTSAAEVFSEIMKNRGQISNNLLKFEEKYKLYNWGKERIQLLHVRLKHYIALKMQRYRLKEQLKRLYAKSGYVSATDNMHEESVGLSPDERHYVADAYKPNIMKYHHV